MSPVHQDILTTLKQRAKENFHFVACLWSYVEKGLIKKIDPTGRLAPSRVLQKRITEIRF